jgi:hypothetical protein
VREHALDGVIDELLESFELSIEGLDDPINAGLELMGHDLPAVLLHGAQRDELAAANDQVFDGLSVCVGGGASDGLHGGGETSDETGVDRIGFGELTDGIGEAPDFQRRDDDDGQACGECRTDERLLEPAGSFDDDPLNAITTQRADQSADIGL